MRWLDGAVLLEGSQEYGAVAWTGAELVVCSGRRIYRLADGEYAGSASALVPLPETLGGPGLLVFTRRGFASTSVGLMSGELREVDALAATVTAEGEVHSIRIFGRRVWIVGDRRISSYAVSAGALVEPVHLDYAGAFDVDWVDPDHLVVAGCTGCAIIRWRDGRVLPEPRVVFERHGPGCLQGARSDGRFVLAGGPLGTWMYEIGRKARPVPRVTDAFPAPATEVVTVAGRVSVGRDGRTVTVSAAGGDRSYAEPGGAAVHCLAAAGGAVWIGHDLGVTVLPLTADPGAGEIARIRLDGPVLYLFPRLAGGGVVFVSQNGGMGVISLSADG